MAAVLIGLAALLGAPIRYIMLNETSAADRAAAQSVATVFTSVGQAVALAVSLLVSVGHFDGLHSPTFAVSIVLAFIIVDDALRIRMILGDQGRYLNMLVDQLRHEIDPSKFPHLKERVGHRTSEVIAGALFGFFCTAILIALLAA